MLVKRLLKIQLFMLANNKAVTDEEIEVMLEAGDLSDFTQGVSCSYSVLHNSGNSLFLAKYVCCLWL